MPDFTAPIRKVGILRCVTVPAKIVAGLGTEARIPVVARYGGETTTSTLVPAGGGQRRLTLRMEVLRPAKLDAGDSLVVSLARETGSPDPSLPDDLRQALQLRPRARAAYEGTTSSLRRQIVRHLESARQAATRESRLEFILEKLADGSLR